MNLNFVAFDDVDDERAGRVELAFTVEYRPADKGVRSFVRYVLRVPSPAVQWRSFRRGRGEIINVLSSLES